jgi:hypothetical protein
MDPNMQFLSVGEQRRGICAGGCSLELTLQILQEITVRCLIYWMQVFLLFNEVLESALAYGRWFPAVAWLEAAGSKPMQ